jgi:hypothetical protein
VTGKLYTVQASTDQIGELASDTHRGRTRFENHRSGRPKSPSPVRGLADKPKTTADASKPADTSKPVDTGKVTTDASKKPVNLKDEESDEE